MGYHQNIIYVLAPLLFIILAVVVFLKRRNQYWKSRGAPQLEPEFFFGDTRKLITGKYAFGEQFLEIYRKFKAKGVTFGGAYFLTRPFIMPLDMELIKCILVRDFDHFVNHGLYVDEEVDPLTGHLFNLEDAKWRTLRMKLTPTFTSGKMKMMFQTLLECTNGLKVLMEQNLQGPIDIKEILARFTTDIIGSCAFGLECNCMKDPDAEFRKYGKKALAQGTTLFDRLRVMIPNIFPKKILHSIGFKVTNTEVERFFMNAVKDTVSYREKNNVYKKDFMHLLIQLKNLGKVTDDERVISEKGSKESVININELAAQCFVFFIAGFETSSSTMAFGLYELAVNQDIQENLREEINTVLKKYDDKVTYEAIMEMDYLDKVIKETLRLHPPVPGLPRVCNKPYIIPGTNVKIEKGIRIHIPILGIHLDPDYYPDPEKFDPERFTEENKAKRPSFSWLPFGEGPRLCIGLRFGLMQSKIGIVTIIRNFKITLNNKTISPLQIDNTSFINSAKGGIWLNATNIS